MKYADDCDFLRLGYYNLAKELFFPGLVGDAIDIGGNSSGVWQKLLPGMTWHETPPYPEFDVEGMSLFYEEGFYDYAFLDQVLEHVRHPYQALTEVYDCMQPGGWIFVGTPFLIHVHADPVHDFYRWTREGLEQLLTEAGFESVQMGSWGNRRAAKISMQDWTTWGQVVKDVGEEEALSIVEENDCSRPIIVFAKAKKPGKHRGEV
jgi:SAM-dependent methyltransferase